MRLQKLLLEVMGHKRLLESHDDTMLLQKIQLRAPYVTPLNVLQVPTSALAPSLSAALPSLYLSEWQMEWKIVLGQHFTFARFQGTFQD